MKAAALLFLVVGVAFPYVVGYHVEPVQAAWSGWEEKGDTSLFIDRRMPMAMLQACPG